ncbi:MAG: DoxX family protein, partial [Candidatus Bathyarchaeia archaeon]
LLRIWVGINMVGHGYPKIGKGRKQTVDAMKGFGVPVIAVYLVALLEFFGGLGLIIGFLVPIIALFIAIEMIANSVLKATKMKGSYLSGQNPAAYEIDITYLMLAIVLIVLGAGVLSVDSFLGF